MSQEHRSKLIEHRDQSATTGTAGGYTVPQSFRAVMVDALKYFGGIRTSRAEVITTDDGRALPMPTDNDTSAVGYRLGENVADTGNDVTFGQVTLNAFKYSSKLIKVPVELLTDSAFNLEPWLAQKLGTRIGRIQNTEFTTGTGSSQPQGLLTAATAGPTAASATGLTYNDLLGLKFSVDVAYRQNGEWEMNDLIWQVVLKLVDSTGRPLVTGVDVGLAAGQPTTLMGQPVRINNDLPSALAVNAKTILYGDMSLFKIRDVKDITLVKFTERFMDQYQYGFAAIMRSDARLVDAGTHPVKYLLQPAS